MAHLQASHEKYANLQKPLCCSAAAEGHGSWLHLRPVYSLLVLGKPGGVLPETGRVAAQTSGEPSQGRLCRDSKLALTRSQGWKALEEPLSAVLQQLKAVVAGHVSEDGQRIPELLGRLRVAQRPAALVAVPPQVSTQHLRTRVAWCSHSFRGCHRPASCQLCCCLHLSSMQRATLAG